MTSSPSQASVGAPAEPSLVFEPGPQGALRLRLFGRLDVQTTGRIWRDAIARVDQDAPRRLVLDATQIAYCDGAGLGLLLGLRAHQRQHGREFELEGLRSDLEQLLHLYDPDARLAGTARRGQPLGFVARTGQAAIELGASTRQLVAFVGELTAALVWAVRHPRRVRRADLLLVAERAGAEALPLVLLVGFLMGLILAFQSAVQLKRFAAEIFVADAVGISLARELGALMTAIILAGRTGSAFAAEIGTMKVNEEVDALTTMGLAPVSFLVVTRVVAAVAVTPLLSLFFDLAGVVGALVVMTSLGYPPVAFWNRLIYAVTLRDILGGLVKAFTYGILVAAVGCLRGLQTGKGASAVGASATSAVVSGIVLIAFASGVFSVVFYVLGL
ncbi:MAG TPA: ABC transporter permease [Deltaproteobacteria bacterium]|nr:ABC transporter permease [Deltaproteobacteria bacterium]